MPAFSEDIKKHLQANLDWFAHSGVMDPQDGAWGIAERVILTEDNDALDMIYRVFPYYTEFDGYSILEHRRADCNFQSAWLFYLSAKALEKPEYFKICENILRYLFNRSGMRCMPYEPQKELVSQGLWNWSTPRWRPTLWLDDNAWVCVCCLALSQNTDLEEKFNLKQTGLDIAEVFATQLDEILKYNKDNLHLETFWSGEPESPHWGAMVAMALATAFAFSNEEKYLDAAQQYFDYLETRSEHFTTSEKAYMALGYSFASIYTKKDVFVENSKKWCDILIGLTGPQGNIASQWRETAAGQNLVDIVYTQNWAIWAWGNTYRISGDEKYKQAFETSISLLMQIQDTTEACHLKGCWRGLYDLQNNRWGGGDKFEGGANSIYTGWTNTPIAISLAEYLLDQNKQ